MALTDQQQTDLYNRVMGGIPGGSAVGRSGRLIDSDDLPGIADAVLGRDVPWHGFDGNVPTSGRNTTNLRTDLGYADARAAGVINAVTSAVNAAKSTVTSDPTAVQAAYDTLVQKLESLTLAVKAS